MAENYYPDDSMGMSKKGMMGKGMMDEEMGGDMMGDKDEMMEKEEGNSTLLPISVFKQPNLKPGDTFTGKIVHIYDDEVEVAIDGGGEDPGSDLTADQELDSLAKE